MIHLCKVAIDFLQICFDLEMLFKIWYNRHRLSLTQVPYYRSIIAYVTALFLYFHWSSLQVWSYSNSTCRFHNNVYLALLLKRMLSCHYLCSCLHLIELQLPFKMSFVKDVRVHQLYLRLYHLHLQTYRQLSLVQLLYLLVSHSPLIILLQVLEFHWHFLPRKVFPLEV